MRIITLQQPFASFIPLGLKKYETRTFPTTYRGELLIHSAQQRYTQFSLKEQTAIRAYQLAGWKDSEPRSLNFLNCDLLPLGKVIAIADLTDCIKMTPDFILQQTELERVLGDWSVGRYAWKLENIRELANPIPWKGAQGLRVVSDELKHLVEKELVA